MHIWYSPTAKDDIKGYDVWVLNCTEVEIDVLTGEYKVIFYTLNVFPLNMIRLKMTMFFDDFVLKDRSNRPL